MKFSLIIKVMEVALFMFLSGVLSAQQVTDADFRQERNKVVVTYTLDKSADISLYVSGDGGKTFEGPLKSVSGDVGKGVPAGRNTIVWDVLSDMDQLVGVDNICFKVMVSGGSYRCPVTGMEFVYVEGGTFTMGATAEQGSDVYDDELPAHEVTLSSYYIGKYEVTQAQWELVMGRNPSSFKGYLLPVENVSWDDIQEFIDRLNEKTGKKFRLPTEAEWEYAARGGNKSKGYKYAGSDDIGAVAWYDGNSGGKTHPIGEKFPNELGIYDMSGNVWEWCQDRYGAYSSSSQRDPKGPNSGSYRRLRGGSWHGGAVTCRVSMRSDGRHSFSDSVCGFRLVLLP